ncbi:MAG: 4-hydroxy-tetrahydrodipicolinate synthase [Desulfobacterales bacterium]|nr:4-hydroxy-tetrahydrodipicolinate synthase [Desulfobacterales bacterium]
MSIKGSFTALVTPFKDDSVDYEGLDKLIDFQMENGISGILAVGTTGESPTLNWDEHNRVIEKVAEKTKNTCICIAGTGSNNTKEAIEATGHAAKAGVDAVLLVDPYYNGPSSLEIRKEYIEPVAKAFPDVTVIPYIIPGRTGAQMFPEDLAILYKAYKNVDTVKEATGDPDNMKNTRSCCGPDFTILSGDDDLTFKMMTDAQISASGIISVVTNVAPKAVVEMVKYIEQGNSEAAEKLEKAIKPLFGLVVVKTHEATPYGEVMCRARNPLAIKTLMAILGMPSGGCRQPLGRMTKKGLETVLETGRQVQADNPEILKPVADFFNVDIDERLNNPENWEDFYYTEY